MKPTLLISTFYQHSPVVRCISQFKIDKLLLLVDMEQKNNIQEKALNDLKKLFGGIVKIETISIPVYDVYMIAKITVELLRKHSEENEIIINISGGRKTQAMGVVYGASLLPNFVKKIIYVIEETKDIIELPVFSIRVSPIKTDILKKLRDDVKVPKIAEEFKISRSMVYSHIRDLKEKGYLDNKNNLTLAGKIVLL